MDVKQAAYELKAEFARHAMWDRIERERRYNAELRRRIEAPEEKRRERERNEQLEAALATPVHVANFKARLDTYDAATVEALMNNERQLGEVRERVRNMLLEAHVLPDGRRVFRTRDGKQVFDESGKEVSPEVIRPEEIDRRKPVWEDYRSDKAQEARLVEERKQLQDYQQKLDDARTKVNEGDLTKNELDKLGDELEKAMPGTVRDIVQRKDSQHQQISKERPSQDTTELSPDSPPKSDRRGISATPLGPGRG